MTKTQNIMMNGRNSLTKDTKQAEQPLGVACSTFLCYHSIPGRDKKVRRKPMTLNNMLVLPAVRDMQAKQTNY